MIVPNSGIVNAGRKPPRNSECARWTNSSGKRRNFHLGHQSVDREIEQLDGQIRNSAAMAKRVGGDERLAVYDTRSIEPLIALLRAYHHEQDFRVGWKSTAEKDKSRLPSE